MLCHPLCAACHIHCKAHVLPEFIVVLCSLSIQEVFHESLNFFYVNIGLNKLGLSFIPE